MPVYDRQSGANEAERTRRRPAIPTAAAHPAIGHQSITTAPHALARATDIVALQQSIGNQAVQRLLERRATRTGVVQREAAGAVVPYRPPGGPIVVYRPPVLPSRREEDEAQQRPTLPPVLIAGAPSGQMLTPDQATAARREQRLASIAARNQANAPATPPVLIGKALSGTAYTPEQANALREDRRQRQQTKRQEKSEARQAAEAMQPVTIKTHEPEQETASGNEAENAVVQNLMQGWRTRLHAAETDPDAQAHHKNKIAGARTSIFTAKQFNSVVSNQADLESDVAAAVGSVQMYKDEHTISQEFAQRRTDLLGMMSNALSLIGDIESDRNLKSYFPVPTGRLDANKLTLQTLRTDGRARATTFKAHIDALTGSQQSDTGLLVAAQNARTQAVDTTLQTLPTVIANVKADLALTTRPKRQEYITATVNTRVDAPDLLREAKALKIKRTFMNDEQKTLTDFTNALNDAVTAQHVPERAIWLKHAGYNIPGNNPNYFMGPGSTIDSTICHFSIFRDSVVKPAAGVNETTATIVANLLAVADTSGHHITMESEPKLHVYRPNVRRPFNPTAAQTQKLNKMKTKLDEEVTRVTSVVTTAVATKGRSIPDPAP